MKSEIIFDMTVLELGSSDFEAGTRYASECIWKNRSRNRKRKEFKAVKRIEGIFYAVKVAKKPLHLKDTKIQHVDKMPNMSLFETFECFHYI